MCVKARIGDVPVSLRSFPPSLLDSLKKIWLQLDEPVVWLHPRADHEGRVVLRLNSEVVRFASLFRRLSQQRQFQPAFLRALPTLAKTNLGQHQLWPNHRRKAARVSHDSPRAQTCTFEGRGLQKHHQNSTRRPPERGKKE